MTETAQQPVVWRREETRPPTPATRHLYREGAVALVEVGTETEAHFLAHGWVPGDAEVAPPSPALPAAAEFPQAMHPAEAIEKKARRRKAQAGGEKPED